MSGNFVGNVEPWAWRWPSICCHRASKDASPVRDRHRYCSGGTVAPLTDMYSKVDPSTNTEIPVTFSAIVTIYKSYPKVPGDDERTRLVSDMLLVVGFWDCLDTNAIPSKYVLMKLTDGNRNEYWNYKAPNSCPLPRPLGTWLRQPWLTANLDAGFI